MIGLAKIDEFGTGRVTATVRRRTFQHLLSKSVETRMTVCDPFVGGGTTAILLKQYRVVTGLDFAFADHGSTKSPCTRSALSFSGEPEQFRVFPALRRTAKPV